MDKTWKLHYSDDSGTDYCDKYYFKQRSTILDYGTLVHQILACLDHPTTHYREYRIYALRNLIGWFKVTVVQTLVGRKLRVYSVAIYMYRLPFINKETHTFSSPGVLISIATSAATIISMTLDAVSLPSEDESECETSFVEEPPSPAYTQVVQFNSLKYS